jgi:hypothetical protein
MEFLLNAASCKKLTVGKQSIRYENEVQLTDAIFKFNHFFSCFYVLFMVLNNTTAQYIEDHFNNVTSRL